MWSSVYLSLVSQFVCVPAYLPLSVGGIACEGFVYKFSVSLAAILSLVKISHVCPTEIAPLQKSQQRQREVNTSAV